MGGSIGFYDGGSKIPLEVQVSHFTPAEFPLVPVVNIKSAIICRESWDLITSSESFDENGAKASGMTLFYNEFYDLLNKADQNRTYDPFIVKSFGGQNSISAKGSFIFRLVNFILKIENSDRETFSKLNKLGRAHNHMHIHPWQYSVLLQTLLLTVASRLGQKASTKIMYAWVNLAAFVLKAMLPTAIKGRVKATDHFINIKAESVKSSEKELDSVKSQVINRKTSVTQLVPRKISVASLRNLSHDSSGKEEIYLEKRSQGTSSPSRVKSSSSLRENRELVVNNVTCL